MAASEWEVRVPVDDEVAGPAGERVLHTVPQVDVEHQGDPLGEEVLVEEVGLELRLGRTFPADDGLEVGDGGNVRLHRFAGLVDDDLWEVAQLAGFRRELLA